MPEPKHRRAKKGRSSALAGILASVSTGGANMLSGIVVIPLIIQTVGAHEYGVWLTLSASATLLFYTDLGIGSAIIHFGSVTRGGGWSHSVDSMLTTAITFMAGIWLAVTGAYFLVVAFLIAPSSLLRGFSETDRVALIAASTLLLLALLLKPFESTLIGSGNLVLERNYQLYASIFRIVATATVCFLAPSIALVATVDVIFMLAPLFMCSVTVLRRRIARLSPSTFDRRTLKELLSYGGRSFAVAAIGAALLQSGTFLVAATSTPSAVTFFTAASRIYGGLRQIISWTSDPFRPVLSRMWSKNPASAAEAVTHYSFMTVLVTYTAISSVSLMAHDLVRVWLGSTGIDSKVPQAITVLIAGLALNVLHIPLVAATDARGRPGITFPYQLSWLLSYIGLGIVLGNWIGIVGIAYAMALPLLVIEPLIIFSACKSISLSVRTWSRAVFLPVVAIIFVPLIVSLGIIHFISVPAAGFIAAGANIALTSLIVLQFRRMLPISELQAALNERL